MNVLRWYARTNLRAAVLRSYSTDYVPPVQLRDMYQDQTVKTNERAHPLGKPPLSPSFYSGRAQYYDRLEHLQKSLSLVQGALKKQHLLPLPVFALASVSMNPTLWQDRLEMSSVIGAKLTTGRHRKVIASLNEMNLYLSISQAAGLVDLAENIGEIIQCFESLRKDAYLLRNQKKPVVLDKYGRSYTLGKRKTSSARVWMIPVQTNARNTHASGPPTTGSDDIIINKPDHRFDELVELAGGLPTSDASGHTPRVPVKVTTTTILVNGMPINEYFPSATHREAITRPLRLAGLLGAYNIFGLVRGGGTSSQSGALAHGIASGLAAHDPAVAEILRKSKLTRRDPRMVERKKTGKAKARKRYTWVKR